jgi:hypothetical protein
MPKYLFRLNNGSPEDHVVDLPDDQAALDEGLKTAAGLVGDISLPRIGSETHMLEVTEEDGILERWAAPCSSLNFSYQP